MIKKIQNPTHRKTRKNIFIVRIRFYTKQDVR